MNEPKTIPEKLDAAANGDEFAQVLTDWLDALAKAKDDE